MFRCIYQVQNKTQSTCIEREFCRLLVLCNNLSVVMATTPSPAKHNKEHLLAQSRRWFSAAGTVWVTTILKCPGGPIVMV